MEKNRIQPLIFIGEGELVKKILFLVALFTASNLTLFAQAISGQTIFGQTVEHRMVHHKDIHAPRIAPQEAPQGTTTIFSNLGSSQTYLYNYLDTWLVAGPNSILTLSNFIAMPFTPHASSHISQVQVAVSYDGVGADQVNLSIYSDSKGHPGKILAGPVTVTHLPKAITCCQLAVADFTPLAVNANTQYWVVADTPKSGKGSDFLGEWSGEVAPVLARGANVGGTGWMSFNGNGFPAGQVLGTVPLGRSRIFRGGL
jgi:hypothetical protein